MTLFLSGDPCPVDISDSIPDVTGVDIENNVPLIVFESESKDLRLRTTILKNLRTVIAALRISPMSSFICVDSRQIIVSLFTRFVFFFS